MFQGSTVDNGGEKAALHIFAEMLQYFFGVVAAMQLELLGMMELDEAC